MFGFGKKEKFDSTKLKANMKMATTRIRMQQNKIVNSVKIQRRGLSDLMSIGKYDSARIKVEALIRDDVSIEGLEVLVLFLDLVASRLQVVVGSSTCPPELKESVTSIIWASVRLDTIQELNVVRQQFGLKYGGAFIEMARDNNELSVNQKVLDRLGVRVPTHSACVEYLAAIADEYGVEFDASKLEGPSVVVATGEPGEGGVGSVGGSASGDSKFRIPPIIIPFDDLEARLLALKRQ